jgi:hypothetical protein
MVRISALALIIVFASIARAEVLFEGYSKIVSGETPVGYIISKYEFDAKTKRFISTYFLKTAGQGDEITESLKAYSNDELGPLSYEYTSIVGKKTKTIDAKFKGLKMTAEVKDNGKKKTIRTDIKKGTFLSTFLVYLMLKSKEGLKTNSGYDYLAIAEEDAVAYKGEASVGKEESFLGLKAFKVQNKFKDVRFVSYVNERGEVLGTNSVSQGISTELVADPEKATKGFPLSPAILKNLFGEVPAGKNNLLAKSNETSTTTPGKQQGIPPGQGIQIKTQTSPPTEPKGK